MIRTFGRAFILALAGASASVGAVGCTGSIDGGGDVDQDRVGVLGLELQFGSIVVNTVSYAITGNGFTKSGTFSVAGPGTSFTALIGGIPAGNGYTITLNATATDGVTTGTGSAPFNIVARQETAVTVHLVFRGQAPNLGSLLVNGTSNFAPSIASLTALPLTVVVGATSDLVALATDTDNAPSPLTYAWSATANGSITTGATTAIFTGTSVGDSTVTLVVSDSDATDTLSLVLHVVAAGGGAGTGGTGGSAGAAGSGGGAGTGGAGGSGGTAGAAGIGGTGGAGGTGGTGGTGGIGGTGGTGGGGSPLAACTTCESVSHNGNTSCPDGYNSGLALQGVAAGGTQAGVARSVLFQQILDCIHTTHCAAPSPLDGSVVDTDCLCGIGVDPNACFQTPVASLTGPCRDEIAAGSESSLIGDISNRFTNPVFPIGAAIQVIETCDQFECVAECL